VSVRTRPAFGVVGLAVVSAFALAACGDVESKLITGGATGGSSGTSNGGTTGGTVTTGGTAAGGAAGSGSGTGGATGGTGGTPECTGDDDCTDGEHRFCNTTTGRCSECLSEAPCSPTENCSLDIGECANPCTSMADCTDGEDRICDPNIHFCVECQFDTDCSSNVCAFWKCQN
jgi:hypothetical protein